MNSGITVNDEIRGVFDKLNKRKLQAFVVQIDDTEMKVSKEFEKEGFTFEGFAEAFPEDEGRIACIELKIPVEDGRVIYEILCILWCPINAKSQKKMKYSTSFKAFVNEFTQIAKDIQIDDRKNLTEEELAKRLLKKK